MIPNRNTNIPNRFEDQHSNKVPQLTVQHNSLGKNTIIIVMVVVMAIIFLLTSIGIAAFYLLSRSQQTVHQSEQSAQQFDSDGQASLLHGSENEPMTETGISAIPWRKKIDGETQSPDVNGLPLLGELTFSSNSRHFVAKFRDNGREKTISLSKTNDVCKDWQNIVKQAGKNANLPSSQQDAVNRLKKLNRDSTGDLFERTYLLLWLNKQKVEPSLVDEVTLIILHDKQMLAEVLYPDIYINWGSTKHATSFLKQREAFLGDYFIPFAKKFQSDELTVAILDIVIRNQNSPPEFYQWVIDHPIADPCQILAIHIPGVNPAKLHDVLRAWGQEPEECKTLFALSKLDFAYVSKTPFVPKLKEKICEALKTQSSKNRGMWWYNCVYKWGDERFLEDVYKNVIPTVETFEFLKNYPDAKSVPYILESLKGGSRESKLIDSRIAALRVIVSNENSTELTREVGEYLQDLIAKNQGLKIPLQEYLNEIGIDPKAQSIKELLSMLEQSATYSSSIANLKSVQLTTEQRIRVAGICWKAQDHRSFAEFSVPESPELQYAKNHLESVPDNQLFADCWPAVATALVQKGESGIVTPAVLKRLTSDRDTRVKVIMELVKKSSIAEPIMLELFESTDQETKTLALNGLKVVGGEKSLAVLKEALKSVNGKRREQIISVGKTIRVRVDQAKKMGQ